MVLKIDKFISWQAPYQFLTFHNFPGKRWQELPKMLLWIPLMKYWWCIIIPLFLLAGCDGRTKVQGKHTILYVSAEATPGGTGAPDAPLRSVMEARDLIRVLKEKDSQQDFTVMIHGGFYRLDQTIVFTKEDAAVEGHTITYKAMKGERPVFSSGIPVTGWMKCLQDPPYLADEAKGNLWVATIPEGADAFTVMFDEQGRLPRAIGPEVKPLLPRTDARV